MAFPDRIERTLDLPHAPEKVWRALTTADGLGGWFGSKAEIDLRPGGEAHIEWAEQGASGTLAIQVVEPLSRFGFSWGIDGLTPEDPRRTYVEFALEPTGDGTRLTVTESGFAQLPEDVHAKAYGGNTEGWTVELGELVEYLDAQA